MLYCRKRVISERQQPMSEHPPTLLIVYLHPDHEEGAGYQIDETLTTSGITYRLIGQMEKRVSLESAAPFIITHRQKRIIFALHAPLHQQGIDDMAQLVSAGLILGFVVKGEIVLSGEVGVINNLGG
jgi:hypothetical protein